MKPIQYPLMARLCGNARSDLDWRDFCELYETPLLATASAAGFSADECSDILQEILVCLVKNGFETFFSNPKSGFCEYLSHKTCVYFQKAKERRILLSSYPCNPPFRAQLELPAQERIQDFLYQHLGRRILESFIETHVFNQEHVRAVHRTLVGTSKTRGQKNTSEPDGNSQRISSDIYDAIIEALRLVQQSIDQGLSLGEALRQLDGFLA
jgi:hypothetical protein